MPPMFCVAESMTTGLPALPQPLTIGPLNVATSEFVRTDVEPGARPPAHFCPLLKLPFVIEPPVHVWLSAWAASGVIKAKAASTPTNVANLEADVLIVHS